MFRLCRLPTVALPVVVLIIAACGGGDVNHPSPTPGGSPSGTAASPKTPAGGVIDLAGVDPLFAVKAPSQDLATGSTSVALGDFNDDGETDALIGAPQADGPKGTRPDAGEAHVFFGPLEGKKRPEEADMTIYGALPGDNLGFTVFAGDLNGDGRDDVIVGAPGVTAGFDPRSDQGRVYVFYGGSELGKKRELDLTEDVFDFTVTGAEGFSRVGDAVAMGDVNGDKRPDLVVGAPFAGRKPGTPPGGERTTLGEVYVIFGGEDLFGELNIAGAAPNVLLSGSEAFGQFGSGLAVADVNDDGVGDIIVSAHRSGAAAGRPQGGAVYVFFGKKGIGGRLSVQDGAQDVTIAGPTAGAGFGFPLAAGDFNGDGVGDIAAGARTESAGGRLTAGTVRIVFGSKGLIGERDLARAPADVTLPGTGAGEVLPSSLAAADIDGDGADELAVGSMLAAPQGRAGAGVVYIMRGGKVLAGMSDLSSEAAITVLGGAADDRLGNALAVAPSVGRALIVSAPGSGSADAGGNVFVLSLEER